MKKKKNSILRIQNFFYNINQQFKLLYLIL